MNGNKLKMLAGISLALIVLLAALQFRGRDTAEVDARMLPELRDGINAVADLRITRAGEEGEILVRKTPGGWVMASRGDYPADIGKLREFLLALADARLVEQKTAKPENHGQLGLRDPATEGSKGARLQITGEGIDIDLIVGNVAQPGYRYARKFDDPQSWLIDMSPALPNAPGDWLVTDVVDIKADEVRTVTIAHADGETIRLGKESAEQTDFDVADIPAGRELSYPTVGNGIAGALNALSFDDVRPGDAFADATTTTTFETFDGVRVEVLSRKEEDGDWISIRASADEDEDAAASINARTGGWQYRIAGFKANQLTRRWEDILKAEAEAESAE